MGLWALSHAFSLLASSSDEMKSPASSRKEPSHTSSTLAFMAATQGADSPITQLLRPMKLPICESPRTTENKEAVLITLLSLWAQCRGNRQKCPAPRFSLGGV